MNELKQHPYFKEIDWEALKLREAPAPYKPTTINDADISNICTEFTKPTKEFERYCRTQSCSDFSNIESETKRYDIPNFNYVN